MECKKMHGVIKVQNDILLFCASPFFNLGLKLSASLACTV
jgi:hypothetical protein